MMKEQSKKTRALRELIASNVRERRLRLGLSQEGFAEKCNYHRTYISSIERGERNITIETLAALAKALEVKPDELLRGDG